MQPSHWSGRFTALRPAALPAPAPGGPPPRRRAPLGFHEALRQHPSSVANAKSPRGVFPRGLSCLVPRLAAVACGDGRKAGQAHSARHIGWACPARRCGDRRCPAPLPCHGGISGSDYAPFECSAAVILSSRNSPLAPHPRVPSGTSGRNRS